MQKIIIRVSLLVSLLVGAHMSFAQNLNDGDPSNGVCVNIQTNILRFRSSDAMTGGDVSELQDFLIAKGLLSGNASGYYGRLTVSAVKAYQRQVGVSPTGNVGPLTRAYIKKDTCSQSTIPTVPVDLSSTSKVVCTTEYRICPDGKAMPRDSDCSWRADKCSGIVSTTSSTSQGNSSRASASIKVINRYDKEILENRLFPMFTVSGIDNSSLLSITLKEVKIAKGDYVSIRVNNSCNTVLGGIDQLLPNYSISGTYNYGGGLTSTFSCPSGIKDLKDGVSLPEKVATLTSDSDTLSYSITASDSWGPHADVNGKTAPSGRLTFYGVREDGTQEFLKTVTFRYSIR